VVDKAKGTQRWMEQSQARAAELRQKAFGFAGLESPFRGIKEKLTIDFRNSAAVKHPGDKGTARENILRGFLKEGYLPAKYGISDGSSHVLSSTGHISGQLDLLFFDALNAPRLMTTGGIQYFPLETTTGVIETKSDLSSRAVVIDGLDQIASYKRLKALSGAGLADGTGFGILFGYTASLAWPTLFETVSEWQATRPPQEWPNLVVALDHGIIGHALERDILLHTHELRKGAVSQLWPFTIGEDTLLSFYLLLVDLLGNVSMGPAPMRAYARLPATAGDHFYAFIYGAFSEIGWCKKHGEFLRMITPTTVDAIIAGCRGTTALSHLSIVNHLQENGDAQPDAVNGVLIYNPDTLPLQRVLQRPATFTQNGKVFRADSLAYVPVEINGREYWLPDYYILRDRLITGCPRCPAKPFSMNFEEWWRALERLTEAEVKTATEQPGPKAGTDGTNGSTERPDE
jgi:hypothetical protein